MTKAKQSKQLARVIAVEGLDKGTQRVVIKYDRIDEDKKGMSAGNLKTNLDKATADKVKALKTGDEIVIVKEEGAPDKSGKSYWNLVALETASTFVKKEKTAWGGNNKGNGGKSSYDPYGATIGMMFNNAVLISIEEGLLSVDDREVQIMTNAKELVHLVQEFDNYARPILEKSKSDVSITLPRDVSAKLKEDAQNAVPVDEDWNVTLEDGLEEDVWS